MGTCLNLFKNVVKSSDKALYHQVFYVNKMFFLILLCFLSMSSVRFFYMDSGKKDLLQLTVLY